MKILVLVLVLHQYSMNGEVLKEKNEERDIEVKVSTKLKPTAQCNKAAQTAMTVLGQLRRAFHFRGRHTSVSLYRQYVLPHLEFAAPVWSP
jgi:hypothetical protein